MGSGLWQASLPRTQVRSDPDIVGRPLRVNGRPATVIGVMPDGFEYPSTNGIWVPLQRTSSG